MTLLERISELSAAEFESLVYDCARSVGVRNLVWRTPGADGGPDLEGQVVVTDVVGVDNVEKWYIECKRYQKSIDWPTLWKKIAYADCQRADVLLLATNSNPSPNCETEISNWNNSRRRPAVRVWRGYSFEEILTTRPQIKRSHGLEDPQTPIGGEILSLTRLIVGVTQSANSGFIFESDISGALETAAILSELLEQRLSDIVAHGRFGSGELLHKLPDFDWLTADGDYTQIEDIAFNAVLVALHYFSGATTVSTTASENTCNFVLSKPKIKLEDFSRAFTVVLEWSCAEIDSATKRTSEINIKFRNQGPK